MVDIRAGNFQEVVSQSEVEKGHHIKLKNMLGEFGPRILSNKSEVLYCYNMHK